MFEGASVALLMPARDEASTIERVLRSVPPWVDSVVVVDNGSVDGTGALARELGARVEREPLAGYGRACLRGLRALAEHPPDIVAFADADGSDDLSHLDSLIQPIAADRSDFVLARRRPRRRRAMTWPQRFGNRLATTLIQLRWGQVYRDLGPMRAISWVALSRLEMDDPDFGWTVQMQIRAAARGLRIREFDVSYRERLAGRSKVSGTIRGSFLAGLTILKIIAREARRGRGRSSVRRPAAESGVA